MKINSMGVISAVCLLAGGAASTIAQADVTITQKTNLDVASLIEAHITLEDINAGYDAMRQRTIQGRRVIMFPN